MKVQGQVPRIPVVEICATPGSGHCPAHHLVLIPDEICVFLLGSAKFTKKNDGQMAHHVIILMENVIIFGTCGHFLWMFFRPKKL